MMKLAACGARPTLSPSFYDAFAARKHLRDRYHDFFISNCALTDTNLW